MESKWASCFPRGRDRWITSSWHSHTIIFDQKLPEFLVAAALEAFCLFSVLCFLQNFSIEFRIDRTASLCLRTE